LAKFSTLLKSSSAAAILAAVTVPVGGSVPAHAPEPAARAPLDVKVAESKDFSRVEFHWAAGAKAASRREGQTIVLRFNRNAQPDLSRLRVFPPKWMKGAEARTVNGGLEVRLLLADDADAKVGFADGATYVNAFARKDEPKTEQQAQARSAATPDSGIIKPTAVASLEQTTFTFAWKAPVGAAVFRRGETVWIVFDAKAQVDLSVLPKASPQFGRINTVQGADFTAIAIASPETMPVSATGAGATWTINLGTVAKAGAININRDAESAEPALAAAVAGATRSLWLDDPFNGDRIAVVTALAPSKGLDTTRNYVDLKFLQSAQGLAITSLTADLTVAADGDLVHVSRPKGLTLSTPQQAAGEVVAAEDTLQPAALPALIDETNWAKLDEHGFFARYDKLRNAAAAEADNDGQSTGRGGPVTARMQLARFLVGSDLAHEAIGVLNLLGKMQPAMLNDPELRGLRGAAKAMAGRYNEAMVDLSAPPLTGDTSAALWRGYVSAQTGHYDDARKAYQQGYRAFAQMPPKWRARFARTYAEAALDAGDMRTAKIELSLALDAKAGTEEDVDTSFVQARILETEGDKTRALAIYDTLASGPNGAMAAAGQLHATQLRTALNQIQPAQAAEIYDGLRYRWRGDTTELESTRALGQIYLSMGRYREALEALRSAGNRFSDMPQAVAIQTDLSTTFRALFLDGGADGWEPIQAVALWDDFKVLTPLGADGDLMVRKIARRLVDVDLLAQAATMLKWQVDQRLDGVAKAQVATDLAMVYLMNRQPELALQAINSSRTSVLPTAMNNERRGLTARALIALGRYDQALEILGTDKSAESDDLRADVAWRQRDWKTVGPLMEKRLGDRWKVSGTALAPEDEARLLRAAIAYSLATDDDSLARLRTRFTPFIETARAPEYLKIALTGVAEASLQPGDFNRVMAESDTFAGWVTRMKQRFREKPSPISKTPMQTASAPAPKAAPAKG
jgi:tetratricopeptide (TPR) repeat protein